MRWDRLVASLQVSLGNMEHMSLPSSPFVTPHMLLRILLFPKRKFGYTRQSKIVWLIASHPRTFLKAFSSSFGIWNWADLALTWDHWAGSLFLVKAQKDEVWDTEFMIMVSYCQLIEEYMYEDLSLTINTAKQDFGLNYHFQTIVSCLTANFVKTLDEARHGMRFTKAQ